MSSTVLRGAAAHHSWSIARSVVDITPSKNILLKSGTNDYNLACAIAELVDNSIQVSRWSSRCVVCVRPLTRALPAA